MQTCTTRVMLRLGAATVVGGTPERVSSASCKWRFTSQRFWHREFVLGAGAKGEVGDPSSRFDRSWGGGLGRRSVLAHHLIRPNVSRFLRVKECSTGRKSLLLCFAS